VLAISLALLPFYAWLWRRPVARSVGAATVADVADAGEETAGAAARARAAVTVMLALAVWFSFLTGHVLNNIRGLFGT
jgi:hypothetical protein